jgi:16S rRNA (guanine1207-N2)-methyltransferase
MDVHAVASVLEPRGALFVYGAKDEGIGSAAKSLEELFEDVATVATGGRCRLLTGTLRHDARPRTPLSAWRRPGPLEYDPLPETWTSYPGVFAHGRLDRGTRFLLDALPPFLTGGRILDYGCGSGVVGGVVWILRPDSDLHLLDVDSVALEAARENVPGARYHLRDGLPPPDDGPFDLIVSNPPFHRGKAEEPDMIRELVRSSPGVLAPDGGLVLVAQRRLKLEAVMRDVFRQVTVSARDTAFQVWRGEKPLRRLA